MIKRENLNALFLDSEENSYFVPLRNSRFYLSKLTNALANPFKIVLIHGEPGLGKSFLLQQFYNEHAENIPLFFYKTPTFTDAYALNTLYSYYYQKTPHNSLHKNAILDAIESKTTTPNTIILDEAQLYEDETLEWIRLLSNKSAFRFIIAVHKIAHEDLLAKAHFKTRLFEMIELKPLTYEEMIFYIEKKLHHGDMIALFTLFKRSNFKRIHKYTKGNLRLLNRFLHALITLLYDEIDYTPKLFGSVIKNRYIDAVAYDLGIIK
jgi:4-hydroxy-tetrahydrodipicolinate synthase